MLYSWKKVFLFLLVLAAGFVVALGLWTVALLYGYRSVATHDEYWVEAVVQRKKDSAARKTGGRLIILAGSSGWYGFRTKPMEEILGVPVVNMAVHAGLSIEGVSRDALSIARPGDAILMAFEYEQFLREPFQYRMMGHMLRNHAAELTSLPPLEILRYLMSTPPSEFLFRWEYLQRIARGEDVYAFANTVINLTDEDGEITDRNKKYRGVVDPLEQPKFFTPVNADARKVVLRYARLFRDRGNPVFAVFAPRMLHPDYDREKVAATQEEIRAIYREGGAVPLGEAVIDTAQGEIYFDNGGHLSEFGAIERSRRVAHELLGDKAFQDWLKTRPPSTP